MVEIDSLLAYNWISGQNLKNNKLSILINECVLLLGNDLNVSIKHIYREINQLTNPL